MLELDSFLNWCDTQYDNTQHCHCGIACTNGDYCKGQQNNCYLCIQRVHDYHNRTVHYNCDKMILYYVLKHCYRFGSEIFYALQKLRNDLCNWNDIYIVSIGCGPCTELFGALSQWRTMGKPDEQFHYRGFDTNNIWRSLMNQARSYFTMADVMVDIQSAFNYYQNCEERIDIIVLNYMLSDMMKFNNTCYDQFLKDLISLIQKKRPCYLLINDVYLLISVGATNRMLRFLAKAGLSYKGIKLQYHDFHPYIGQFGRQIHKQPYTMPNTEIVRKNNPFSEVNSIQAIIKFQ